MLTEALQIGLLFGFIIFFHASEYLISKKNHSEYNSKGATLISVPFVFAFSFGIAEFLIESYVFGDYKTSMQSFIMWLGFLLIIVGLFIRVKAETTAKKSFTHHIAYRRVEQHKLITNGVYHYIRHPGYLGMFIFALGTQMFLRNPISFIAFFAVLWKFFSDRIQDEEAALVSMFGRDYVEYRAKTPTWFPFIK